MRWAAALGWAAAGGWLVLVQYLSAEVHDPRDLYLGLFCLGLAALIAIGGRVGRIAAGYGMVAAALGAIGSLLLIGMAGPGAAAIALYLGVLAGASYAATKSV
jgi:hypothetical protein